MALAYGAGLLILGAAAPGHFCWRSDGVQAQRGVAAAVKVRYVAWAERFRTDFGQSSNKNS